MKKLVPFLALIAFCATATAQVTTFKAVLSGANETPVPADPDGAGFALVVLDATNGTVSFTLFETNIANPVAAHIHRGAPGVTGSVIIALNAPFTAGISVGTTTGVAASLLNEISANPAGFYVNIHTGEFPGGAIRGPLSPAGATVANPILFVPVVAKLTGARNEEFVDDLRLVNRSATTANVTLDFFASSSGGLSAPTATHTVTVSGNSQMLLDDVLGSTFGTSGIGALRITADQDVIADSRLIDDERSKGNGTTGMALSAVHLESVCRNGTLDFLSNASDADVSAGLGLRTNIGYFNPTTSPVTIAFTARHNDGSTIGTKTVTVAGLAHAQLRLASLFDSTSANDLAEDDFFATYTVSAGPAFVYAVEADNKTGDTYFIAPSCN